MSGLALFRRKDQPQSLVKAPSADLIKPDTAPELPKMVEIKCSLNPEQLTKYIGLIDNTSYQNFGLKLENLRHLLTRLGYRQYDKNSVINFFKSTHCYLIKKAGWKECNYFSNEFELNYIDSIDLIPPHIINGICKIRNNYDNPDSLQFNILTSVGTHHTIISRPFSVQLHIYFLRVYIVGHCRSEESLIIDAWRGPTFSDEESYLPGQEKI